MTNYPNQIDGYSTLPVLVDLVSPVRAADVNRLRNSIIAIERELGINPSGTYGTVRARLDALELGLGGSIILGGGGGSAGTGEDYLSGMIETPTDKEYFLTTDIPYDGYIHSISTKSSAGSCTLTTKINGIPVGGTPNAVSTTEVIEYTTAPNEFVTGDTLTVEVSGNASCADLSFTVLMFVTPGGEFGEANIGANVGVAGVGPYKQKTGLTLEFRNINAGSNKISVGLDAPNNEIDIDVVESNLTLNNIGGSPLSISKGGTGQSTATNAFNALSPTTTKGDLIVRNNTSNVRLGVGTDGYLLIADSTQPTGVRWGSASFVGANTSLSNLSATAINLSLIPGADDSLDLGSSSFRWRDLYLGPTSLRFVTTIAETGTVRNWRLRVRETAGSTQGSFIIQEGSNEHLYITPTGNVGIGITNPSTILDINGVNTYRGVGSPPAVSLAGQGTIYFDGSTNKFKFSENGGAYQDFGTGGGGGGSGANTALSNLVATNINTSLLPAADDGYDLGGPAQRWRDLYLGPTSLHLVSTSAETTTARDWRMAIAEGAGATQGRFRILEGASEYFNITPAGNIGIGTTVPTELMHLRASSSSPVKIITENAGSGAATSAEHDFVTTSGYGHIGAYNSTYITLPLLASRFAVFNNNMAGITLLSASVGSDIKAYTGGITASFERLSLGTTTVFNEPGNDVDFRIEGDNNQNLFFVDASADKIGIGTATPGSSLANIPILDIVGSGDTKILVRTTSGSGAASYTLQSTGHTNNPYFEFQLVPSNTDKQSYVRYNYVGATTLADILVVKGDGYVGIGTSAPNEALTLHGVLSLQEQAVGPADNAGYGKIFVKQSDSKLYFRNDSGTEFDLTSAGVSGAGATDSIAYWSSPTVLTNSSTFVWKESSQRIGIGTATPSTNAHVFSSTDTQVTIEAGASNKAELDFNTGGVVRADILVDGSISGTPLNINKNHVTNVVIAAGGGDVAFGNIIPSSKIDVDGAITWRGLVAPPVAPAGQGRIYFDTTTSKLKISESGGAYFDISAGIAANINLSNLTATAINTDLLPQGDDGYDLGSELLRWRDGYFGPSSLHIVTKVGETVDPHHWVLGAAEAPGPTQGRFTIRDGNNEFFSVDGYGYVGIGTTIAGSALEINGAISYGGMTAPPVSELGKGRIYFDSITNQFKMSENGGSYTVLGSGGGGGANIALSNLSSTAINQDLLPNTDDTYSLGSPSLRWKDGYFANNSLHIVSTAGETNVATDWNISVIQDGYLKFSNINDGYLTITNFGNVGIGTTQPSDKLYVDGYIKAAIGYKFGDGSVMTSASGGGGGSTSIGSTIAGGTTGSILFIDSGSVLAQDNTNLFWDNTNNRLGIGTTTPTHDMHIAKSAVDTTLKIHNTSTSADTAAKVLVTTSATTSNNTNTRATFTLVGGHPSIGSVNDSDGTTQLIFEAQNTTLSPTTQNFRIVHRPHSSTQSLNLFSDSVTTNGGIMTWLRSGDVGIGISNPTSRLDISDSHTSDTTAFARYVNTSAIGQIPVHFVVNGTTRGVVRSDYGGNLTLASNGGGHYFFTGGDFGSGGTERLQIKSTGELVFNENGVDYDFRIEGDTEPNLIFVDASTDNVGIGTIPNSVVRLHVYKNQNDATRISLENPSTGTTAQAQYSLASSGADVEFAVFGSGWSTTPQDVRQANRANFLLTAGNDLYFSTINTSQSIVFNISNVLDGSAGEALRINNAGVVFNEQGVNKDFRIEGDTDANTLFVDASTDMVGIGTNAPNSKIHITGSLALPITTKTANYTANSSDHTILCDATSGAITITLPTASGIGGRIYVIKKIDSSSNNVIIDGNASETIDGALTQTLAGIYESITIQSNGTSWFIL